MVLKNTINTSTSIKNVQNQSVGKKGRISNRDLISISRNLSDLANGYITYKTYRDGRTGFFRNSTMIAVLEEGMVTTLFGGEPRQASVASLLDGASRNEGIKKEIAQCARFAADYTPADEVDSEKDKAQMHRADSRRPTIKDRLVLYFAGMSDASIPCMVHGKDKFKILVPHKGTTRVFEINRSEFGGISKLVRMVLRRNHQKRKFTAPTDEVKFAISDAARLPTRRSATSHVTQGRVELSVISPREEVIEKTTTVLASLIKCEGFERILSEETESYQAEEVIYERFGPEKLPTIPVWFPTDVTANAKMAHGMERIHGTEPVRKVSKHTTRKFYGAKESELEDIEASKRHTYEQIHAAMKYIRENGYCTCNEKCMCADLPYEENTLNIAEVADICSGMKVEDLSLLMQTMKSCNVLGPEYSVVCSAAARLRSQNSAK